MRLTLRTMLAYLDDILEAADSKELGSKIEESKFASDLVHRIRNSTRKLRLGAPKVEGRGMGADANTVAEYLDNTMPPENVPEFEKVCLESDVQLAEVASCHQVLTLVLGEPAAIEPAMRERMYRIGHPENVGSIPPVSEQPSTGATAPAPTDQSSTPPAMEPSSDEQTTRIQLAKSLARSNEPGLSIKSLALTLLFAFLAAIVALRAMGPFNRNHVVVRWMTGATAPNIAQQPEPTVANPDSMNSPSVKSPAVVEPSEQTAHTLKHLDANKTSTSAETAPQSSDGLPKREPAPATTEPIPVPTTTPAPATPVSVSPPAAPLTPKPLADPMPTVTPVVKPEPTAPVHVGRYISEEQLLTRLDSAKGDWTALAPDSPLTAGEQLLSLPTYRPQILVGSNVKLTFSGEAFVKLHAPEATDVPRISIDLGRFTVVPVGDKGSRTRIDLAGREGTLVFDDVESSVSIEVRPYLPPGSDPQTTTPMIVGQLWVHSGSVGWSEADQPETKLNAGQWASFIDESPLTIATADAPEWIDGKNLSDIDRRASQEMRKLITLDRPVTLTLMELTAYRQVEVKALASRSLCFYDIFEPSLEALGDTQHRAYWHIQLEALQSALALGPDSAAKLLAATDKTQAADAAAVFRLLQGFSPEQLKENGAEQLVTALESSSMTVRVLAFENLKRITGKTQLFRPEERPEQEKARVQKWRKQLEDGLIVYKTEPTPL